MGYQINYTSNKICTVTDGNRGVRKHPFLVMLIIFTITLISCAFVRGRDFASMILWSGREAKAVSSLSELVFHLRSGGSIIYALKCLCVEILENGKMV